MKPEDIELLMEAPFAAAKFFGGGTLTPLLLVGQELLYAHTPRPLEHAARYTGREGFSVPLKSTPHVSNTIIVTHRSNDGQLSVVEITGRLHTITKRRCLLVCNRPSIHPCRY